MVDSKVIAVLGATGAQGGGVVRSFSASEGYSVRAITRNPDSDKAKAIAKLPNVTVVKADLNDTASVTAAFQGAYGVFAVTNFWEGMSPSNELQQAKNIADAAKAASVSHVVWSTLEDTRLSASAGLADIEMEGVKYKVPHFDAKGEADKYFKEVGVPTTFLLTTFYWDNFIHFGMGPKKGDDGKYTVTLPLPNDAVLAGIAAEDIGQQAAAILKDPSYIGQTVGVAGDKLTGDEMAAALSEALGVEVAWNGVPYAVFASFGFPGANDLANMFQWYVESGDVFLPSRDVAKAKQLYAGTHDFKAWLAKYKGKIPL